VKELLLPSANGLVPLSVSVAIGSLRVTVEEAIEVVVDPLRVELEAEDDVDFALVLVPEIDFDELVLETEAGLEELATDDEEIAAAAIWALRRSCQAVSCAAWTWASLFLNGGAYLAKTPGADALTARRTVRESLILREAKAGQGTGRPFCSELVKTSAISRAGSLFRPGP
jgi:hypothetical protein